MWTSSMMMGSKPPIARVGSAQGVLSGSTVTISKPTGVAPGDLLVATVSYTSSGVTWTVPSGWTEAIDSGGLVVAWKIAGGSEPSNYAFTPSIAVTSGGAIVAYRNAALDVVGTVTSGATTSSITLSKDKSALLAYFYASSGTLGAVTGMTAVETRTSPSLSLSEQLLMPAGATGSRTSSGGQVNVLVGLKPA